MEQIPTKIVLLVSPRDSEEIECLRSPCCQEFNISFITVKKLSDAYLLLCDSHARVDIIGIDLDSIYDIIGTDLFDEIKALLTIVKTTFYCRAPGQMVPRSTIVRVGGLATMATPTAVIKDFDKMDNAIKGIFPCGPDFSQDEKRAALEDFFSGRHHIPKRIQTKFRSVGKTPQTDSEDIYLTPRQNQIFRLVVDRGASNKSIARTLSISESTVKLHLSAIFKKYGVRNRTQLAVFSKTH